MLKHINQINEEAFLLDFGSEIDINVNSFVINYTNFILKDIKNNNYLNIKNCVPSYNKILIQFDSGLKNKSKILNYLKEIKYQIKLTNNIIKKIKIPICYDEEYALDLKEISDKKKLSKEKIIDLHLNSILHVYMIGFMPGLPFMGDINKRLTLSRKLSPRTKITNGSVGIVDRFCVIYPNTSPGGWNIIGRTPINLFNSKKKNPLFIKPGFKIKFKSITKKEFNKINNGNK